MSKIAEIQLILIPAAATEWDQSSRLQGGADLPASSTGLTLTAPCIETAAALKPTAVLSAPDEASAQTAKRLAKHLGLKSRAVAALADLSLGLWEGLTESAALERYPSVFKQWRQDPASVLPPEGESFDQGVNRVIDALSKAIEKSNKESFAVVLRPASFRIVSRWAAGSPIAQDWRIGPADDIQTFTLSRDERRRKPLLKTPAGAS